MRHDEAMALLEKHDQTHILRFWDRLNETEQRALLDQIAGLDFESIARMRTMLQTEEAKVKPSEITPAPVIELSEQGNAEDRDLGEAAIRSGQVGALLVAGGQGSRLGFDGPKGSYLLAPISHASLFEIHARKILAMEKKYDTTIPFYIMTSQANDGPTKAFFAENNYFGLNAERVLFFTQGMWPALQPDGSLVLDTPCHLFMSPDGHGGILRALQTKGMLDDMQQRGLTTLFFFQVDNPLVEIADPVFVGLHLRHQAEISVKVCAKRDPSEGLGIVVTRGERSAIVEYTELTEQEKEARLPDGNLRFKFGSVAIHVFSLDFLVQEAAAALPLHIAHKKIPFCDDAGNTIKPDAPNAFKFEKFIFDVIPDAKRSINVEFARENEFSPVKNAEGNDSPATSRRDMILKAARWLTACGVSVPVDDDGLPRHKIEIDPCYAIGPEDLKAKQPPDLSVDGDLLLK